MGLNDEERKTMVGLEMEGVIIIASLM